MDKFQVDFVVVDKKIKMNKKLKLILKIFNKIIFNKNKIILLCLKKIIYYDNHLIKGDCNQELIYKQEIIMNLIEMIKIIIIIIKIIIINKIIIIMILIINPLNKNQFIILIILRYRMIIIKNLNIILYKISINKI